MQNTLGTALAGLVLGAVAVPLVMAANASLGFLVFAALVGLAALRKESRALAGGVLVSFGLWWGYVIRQAVERCDALNRQPGGSCSIFGTEERLVLAGSVVLGGVLLVAIALRNERARA
ncbi:MAG: hypothetical protein M3T56_10425 [Chloroflexota bacterium]|nr:hypothetical protein [Chloroflexota bacterium]